MPRGGRQPGCLHIERPISGLHLRKSQYARTAGSQMASIARAVYSSTRQTAASSVGELGSYVPFTGAPPPVSTWAQAKQRTALPSTSPHGNSVCRSNVSHEPLTSIPAKSATAASGVAPRPRGPEEQVRHNSTPRRRLLTSPRRRRAGRAPLPAEDASCLSAARSPISSSHCAPQCQCGGSRPAPSPPPAPARATRVAQGAFHL